VALRCHRNRCGHGPQKAHHRTGQGHGDSGGMLTFGHESSGALTPPDLGRPAEILDDLGWFCPSQVQLSADLSGIAVRPGAFHQRPAGLGVTGCGTRTLLAPRTRGRLCRDQAHAFHPCSGEIDTAAVANCRHHRDGHGEITRARQPGPWHGVPAVGFDAVTGLLGHEGGGHHSAVIAFFRYIPGEPGATGASRIDKDPMCGLRWPLADEVIEVTLTGAAGPKGDDLGAVLLSAIGDSNRVFVDILSDVQRARLAHG